MGKHKNKHFEKIPKYSPQHFVNKYDIMMEEAKKAKFNNDYDLAEDILIEVFASDCHLKHRACLELAKVYKDIGKYNKAVMILNSLCEGTPLIFEAYYELAMVHILDNKYDEAEACLSKIKNGFNQFLYNEGMGKLRYYQGKYAEAKIYYTKARDLKGYLSRGNSIRLILLDTRLGNFDEALEGIQSTKSYWYNHTGILLEGNIYIQQGKYAEALKTYQKLLSTSYKNAALYRIGYIYSIQRKYKEAVNVLSRVYDEMKQHIHFDGREFIDYENFIYTFIMVCVKDKQYLKAIQLIEEEKLIATDVYNYYYKVYSFCCRMTNIEPKYNCSVDLLSYSGFQSKYYKKEAAYAHIKRRHIEQSDKSGTILNNANIDEVWEYALNNISLEKRTDFISFADVYSIDYPNIGINGEDQLIVVTNPGTNEIITFYPEYKEKMYLHNDNNDEEAKGLYSLDNFQDNDEIIRNLVKDD